MLTLLLKATSTSRVSFDSAFRVLVKKYGLSSTEAKELYRVFYKVLTYYHTIRFMSVYSGFKPRLSGVVEYIYSRSFDINSILDEVKEFSHSVSPTLRIALLYGYPPWFVRDLYSKLPTSELEGLLMSLNERKRWLRINTAKTSIEDAIDCLEKNGIHVKQHKEFKEMLLLEDPFTKVGDSVCVKKGFVVPQDISSYIAVLLLKNAWEDFIDTCSAPGIKLLQVLSQTRVTRAIAVDINERRACVVPKLIDLFLGNVPNLVLVVGDSRTLHYNVKEAAFLIDAPCSNSGAIYADPAVKLHLSRRLLRKLQYIQRMLLKSSLRCAREVFFMTCSIHPLEGEEVVDYLMKKYDNKVEFFQLKSPYIGRGYLGYKCSDNIYRTYPHRVNGQGFFIAAFRVKDVERI